MAFEKDKRIEIGDVRTELGKKVNTSDVLHIGDILASTDLTGNVASARALKATMPYARFHDEGFTFSIVISSPFLVVIKGSGNTDYYIGMVARPEVEGIGTIVSSKRYDSIISYNNTTRTLTLPTEGWYEVFLIGGSVVRVNYTRA